MTSPTYPPGKIPAAGAEPRFEKRAQADRRQEPTRIWGALPPAGRRMGNRRASDHRQRYFVDRFSPLMLIFILMLVMASMVDAMLTVRLLQAGGTEINPLMDRLLDHGILPFVLGKYVLTVIGLPVLLIFKNFSLCGTRMRVGYLIPLIVAMYLALIGYQLFLMQRYAGL
jgi:hypothetical protein